MKSIMRTLSVTGCVGQRINALGEFEPFSDVLHGIWDAAKATSKLRRKWNDQTITINKVEPSVKKYKLSIDDFYKYATPID